jgi:hypothetical protein
VDTANTSYNSLEESANQAFNFVYFTNFKNFLEFSQEQSLLDAVGEWPVLQEAFQEGNSEGSVLGQEEHGASQQLLVELRTSLDFVQRDNHILEENNVFISEGDCETTDDTGKDIKKFCSTVEFVGFVNQGVETFVDCLSYHLSSGDKLQEIVRNFVSEFKIAKRWRGYLPWHRVCEGCS